VHAIAVRCRRTRSRAGPRTTGVLPLLSWGQNIG